MGLSWIKLFDNEKHPSKNKADNSNFFILLSTKGYSCTCHFWFSTDKEESKKEMTGKSGYGFYGTTIEILHPSPWSKSDGFGEFVLMKVDSVFMGNLVVNDTIMILQNSGNCNAALAINESGYVYGYRIKKLKIKKADNAEKKKYWNKTSFWFSDSYNQEYVVPYRDLLKKYAGVNTNQCNMFK